MSRKNTYPHSQSPLSPSRLSSLPQTLHLSNLTNKPQPPDQLTLKMRIQQLQRKVVVLQTKLRSKRKRIRRKSHQVQKKHQCEHCKRQYGSIVSLNLHLRIKHKRQKRQKSPQSPKAKGEGLAKESHQFE